MLLINVMAINQDVCSGAFDVCVCACERAHVHAHVCE